MRAACILALVSADRFQQRARHDRRRAAVALFTQSLFTLSLFALSLFTPALFILALFTVTLSMAVPVGAFEDQLTPEALSQAIAIGQTGIDARRVEFHKPYRLLIGTAPLDYVDVVTPFRRIALAAEARLRAGERLLGQRDAMAMLDENPDLVELRLELTFHPMNTFIGVPPYLVQLIAVASGQGVEPRSVDRLPRFGPRVGGQTPISPTQGVGLAPGPTQPLLGGTVVVAFDGRRLDQRGQYEVVIIENDKVVARAQLDLSALR
jgi:hypothetical protein